MPNTQIFDTVKSLTKNVEISPKSIDFSEFYIDAESISLFN